MEELIKIHEKNGTRIVSARDLHAFLESRQDFSTWIKARIEKYNFVDGVDFVTFHKIVERATRIEYALSMDMAKELAMLEANAKGQQARRYFIACEERLRNVMAMPDFNNPAVAARAWADQFEARQVAEAKIANDAPKVKAAEIMLMSDDGITMAEFAKSIGRGQNRLFKIMREDGYLIAAGNRHNLPYQRYIDAGYLTVKETTQVVNNKVKLFHQTLVTPKGQIYFANKYSLKQQAA